MAWGHRAFVKDRAKMNLKDYPKVKYVEFPELIHVAFAVCTKRCGVREFIVDGSTQRCQTCGELMFRTETAEYRLVRKPA
jgi:hypothetical protein